MAVPRGCLGLPLVAVLLASLCRGQAAVRELKVGYYAETCPEAEDIVRETMARARAREARSVASVMRLQFHDCFVNGCDGSVLMDATPTMPGEKDALSNINSLRSFEVVDEIKDALEERCPGVVSCADIVIMAARDAVVLTTQRGRAPETQTARPDRCVVYAFARGTEGHRMAHGHQTSNPAGKGQARPAARTKGERTPVHVPRRETRVVLGFGV
uniref:Plant heme peroxidase family profile domain-containing protein n=1 Tax=Zea mays TaxID=4577 RepID=C0P2D4_MAIZE|nr:unknown [Zea mays]